ncbi:MAG: hypothetical protein A2Y66_01925 [Nitrospirae bacterium RBG_13_41_22]|nr:MAG: hypothetical protein A2Y66_01925 [Nitrospirae bacterium RBG_13_41_22]
MTDNEIKEKLYLLWSEHLVKNSALSIESWLTEIQKANNYKTNREIGQVMIKAGVARLTVAKIIRGEK